MESLDTRKRTMIENPRSTSEIRDNLFIKTTKELNLSVEATELRRCRNEDIRTEHVRAAEFVSYDVSRNQLVTRQIHNAQSFYNVLWNGTSILSRIRGITIGEEFILSRIAEVGLWLRKYHESTGCQDQAKQVSQSLQDSFRKKIELASNLSLVSNEFLDCFAKKYLAELDNLREIEYQSENGIRFCRIHGDINASNIVADRDLNLHILDFADNRIGANIEDLGRFYELLWAMSQTNRVRKRLFTKALEAFFSSYGVPPAIIDTPFFKAIFAYYGLISKITEFTTRKYIQRQYLCRLELWRLSRISLKRIAKELDCSY